MRPRPAEAPDESEAAPPKAGEHAGLHGDETQRSSAATPAGLRTGAARPHSARRTDLPARRPARRAAHANRYFLELSGHESLERAGCGGGLDKLFAEPGADALAQSGRLQSLSIMSRDGIRRPVEGRLFAVPWAGASALALILTNGEAEERRRSTRVACHRRRAKSASSRRMSNLQKDRGGDARRHARSAKGGGGESGVRRKVSHEIARRSTPSPASPK